MRKNLVLEKLKKRKPSLGTWIEIGHPDVTEVLGNLGLDWFVIDMEHSIHSVERAQVLMQAMATSLTLPFVRVPWNDMVMIKRVLDIGAYGVVIPMVNTKEEAVNAVKACRYPQKGGLRGIGPRRAINYGFDTEYFRMIDDELLIAIQIETETAINNLEDILSVDGIDVAFVGPWDLSMSLGVFQQFDHPKLKKALETVLDKTKEAGVAPGVYSSIDKMNDYIAEGFLFNSLGSDTELLICGFLEALKKIRGWEPIPSAPAVRMLEPTQQPPQVV